jgi:Glycosyl transferase 4-like domain
LLLISPSFPPASDVGALRWQKMARYVAERGWELDVIAFHPDRIESPDWSTFQDLPPGTRVYGIRAPVLRITRLVDSVWTLLRGVRENLSIRVRRPLQATTSTGVSARRDSLALSEIRWELRKPRTYVRAYNAWAISVELKQWARQASALARQIIAPQVHDAIISSAPPQFAHEAARLVSRYSGVPFAIDMRDVWSLLERVLEPVASPLYLYIARRQERRVVNEANLVVTNTEAVRSAMIRKYPQARERIVAVTNGFDDDPIPRTRHGTQFIVAYAGTIYMGRDPVGLFRATRQVVDALNLSPSQFAIKFMGVTAREVSLTEMAEAEGVGAFVQIERTGHRARALEFLAQAAMLVILPQDWGMSIPAKLFEYVRFEAWLLALAERDSATELVLRGTGADVVSPNDISTIAAVLRTRYEEYAAGTRPRPIARDVRLSRRFQAEVLLDAFERCVRPSSRQSARSAADMPVLMGERP